LTGRDKSVEDKLHVLKRIHILLVTTALLAAGLLLSTRDLVVSQKATVSVEGRVHTVGDLPVGGVWVSLIRRGGDGLVDSDLLATLGDLLSVTRIRSDHEGRFSLDLPVGSYDIRAYESGFESFANSRPIEIRANVRIPVIHVALEPTSSVSGRVTGSHGGIEDGVVIAAPPGRK